MTQIPEVPAMARIPWLRIVAIALASRLLLFFVGLFTLYSHGKPSDFNGATLLDHTSVLLTSNLGNASSHDNRNMPVLFAGGGFRHGQHLAFDTKKNYPLPNLYVSVLQQTGLETSRFSTGTGTMRGLEPA